MTARVVREASATRRGAGVGRRTIAARGRSAPTDIGTAPGGGVLHHRPRRHWSVLARVDRAVADRAPLLSTRDCPVLAPDLVGAVAQAGVDPTLKGHALQDALRSAIAIRRGYCSWDVDHASWVVTLHSPEEQDFSGKTLEEGLAWWLAWLMAPELGVGPFLV